MAVSAIFAPFRPLLDPSLNQGTCVPGRFSHHRLVSDFCAPEVPRAGLGAQIGATVATVNLTDKAAKAKKAKAGERLELWDSATPGLCLRVSGVADGGDVRQRKVWVYRYRTLDGRMPRLTLGDYTDRQGVRWARDQAADHRAAVRKGDDPAGERRRKRTEARLRAIRTFDDLADAYLAACRAGDWMPKGKKQSERTMRDAEAIL